MVDYLKKQFDLNGHKLLLYTSTGELFTPNASTKRFSEAVKAFSGLENACVFDIGTGIGPLAIWAALEGASEVHAVDIIEEHIKVARMNVKEYGLENIVSLYQGSLFSPFEDTNMKADIIIADVSGIAEKAARALGWYPPNVPTGGADGTEVIIPLLKQTPKFLAPNGVLYFPVALDLSDYTKTMKTASKYFGSIIPMRDRLQRFPLTSGQVDAVKIAYGRELPHFIDIQKAGSRFGWRGQIYIASQPKL